MARDLSIVRARPGSQRRSGGRPIETGGPTQQLRPTGIAPVAVSSPLASFAEGFDPGFMQAIEGFTQAGRIRQQTKMAEDKMAMRLENTEVLAKFRREVSENREAVLEAVKTGDYSNLSFDASKYIDRPVIMHNLHAMIGQAQAYEDMAGLQQTLDEIDDPMRLNDAVSKYVTESTKGVKSDFYAQAYTETLVAAGRKMIAGRQESIANAGRQETLNTIRGNTRNEFLNPGIEWDQDSVISYADTLVPQLVAGGYTPEEARLLAPEMTDKAVLSVLGDRPDLLHLVDMPDPSREMTTIRSRYPGAVQQAIQQADADHRYELNMVARRGLGDIDRGVSTYGGPNATMDIGQMFTRLNQIGRTYGTESDQYRATEARVTALRKQVFKDEIDISFLMRGELPPLTDKDMNKAMDAAFSRLPLMTPDEQANVMSVMAEDGIEGPLRQRLQRMLNGGPQQREEAITFIQSLKDTSKGGDYTDYLDQQHAAQLTAQEFFAEAGIQPGEYAPTVEAISEEDDPFKYYDNSRTTEKSGGRGVGVQQGGRGSHNLAMQIWNEAVDVPWAFNYTADFDQAPLEIRNLMMDSVNLAAFHLRESALANDSDAIKALAFKIAEGQITYNYHTDKGMVPAVRVGSTTPRSNSTSGLQGMQAAQENFTTNAEAFNEATESTIVATKKDRGYRMGRGELVMQDADGREMPVVVATAEDYAVTVPADVLPEHMKELFVVIDEPSEGVLYGFMGPGKDGDTYDMGNGFKFTYNGENRSWEMRWSYAPTTEAMSIEDVAGLAVEPEVPTNRFENLQQARVASANRTAMQYLDQELANGRIDEQEYNAARERLSTQYTENPAMTDEEFVQEIDKVIKDAEDNLFERTNNRQVDETQDLISFAGNFITGSEARRTVAYDDATGKAITPGTKPKGNPTIGDGFNLSRKDAKKKIEALGYDFEKVKNGEQRISEQDAKKLRDAVVQEEMNWLVRKLERNGIAAKDLTNNQLAALLSMSYHGRGRITSDIIKALKAKDYAKVAELIRGTKIKSSVPGMTGSAGFQARKNKEANMFAGTIK